MSKVDGLPALKDGKAIEYTWKEQVIAEYTEQTPHIVSGTLTTITNKHEPELTRARVKKEWLDSNNQDGKRPGYLQVDLLANGRAVATQTISAPSWEFDTGKTLPKYNNGKLIEYSWEEHEDDFKNQGYEKLLVGYYWTDEDGTSVEEFGPAVACTTYEFSNQKIPDTVEAKILKRWDDNENIANKRPESITVTLMANGKRAVTSPYGEEVEDITLDASNNWTYTQGSLPKNKDGKPVVYTWVEDEATLKTKGYTLTNTQQANVYDEDDPTVLVGTITTLTNTLETGVLNLSKDLISDADADKAQKFTFTVKLDDETINGKFGDMTFTDGEATVELVGGGIATADKLPLGIGYTITEAEAPGFQVSGITVDGNKVETATGTITSTPSDVVFTNKRNQGGFTLDKELLSTSAADKDTMFKFHIVLSDNTITGTYGSIKFLNGEADVQIKGGDVEGAMNLPTGITYTITEDNAPGFELVGITKDGADVAGAAVDGIVAETPSDIVFTNDHLKGDIELSKKMISSRAADADREFVFTVKLNDVTINGTYGDATFQKGVASVSVKNDETKTIEGLPTGVTYEITEASATGFELVGITVDGDAQVNAAKGTITENASVVVFTNDETKGELIVEKTVESTNEADKNKEFNFKVTLEGMTATNNTFTLGDMDFTLDADGKAVAEFTLKAGESKTTGKTVATGIKYTVEEETEDGWTVTKTGETGTISEDVATAHFTNAKTEGGMTVKKIVDSIFETDATRNYGFIITLNDKTINGTYGDVKFTDGVSDRFTLHDGDEAKITGLPDGVEYSVAEDLSDQQRQTLADPIWTNQTGTIGADADVTVTATNHRKTGSIKLTKKVNSNQKSDTTRRFVFTITTEPKLNGTFGDGTQGKAIEFKDGTATVELTNDEVAFADELPYGLKYTIDETTNAAYELTWSGNNNGTIGEDAAEVEVMATNTRTYTKAAVQKVWNDGEDKDGVRPATLTVDLVATIKAGTADEKSSTIATVKLNKDNNWNFASQSNTLPTHDDDGNPISYSWVEKDLPAEYTLVSNETAGTITTITNKHDVSKVNVSVKKVWDDNNNQDGMRATSLNVKLFADDKDVTQDVLGSDHVTLIEDNNWSQTVKDLDKYNAGKEIAYTWREADDELPKGYVLTNTTSELVTDQAVLAEIYGTDGIDETTLTTLTNSYKPKTTTANVKKVWNDSNDFEGFRPKEITVTLMRTVASEGPQAEEVQDVVLNQDNNWSASVANLPLYKDGKNITYSWSEKNVPARYTLTGNTTSGTVTTITNTHTPTLTQTTVHKVWHDNENNDGMRPAYLQVGLMTIETFEEDGQISQSASDALYALSEANNWTITLNNLPAYMNGYPVKYVWHEVETPAGYTELDPVIEQTTDTQGTVVASVTTLTNVHTDETVESQVIKRWNTRDKWEGGMPKGRNAHKIPAELKVRLLADGQQAKDKDGKDIIVTLNKDNDWDSGVISDLPRYNNGKGIYYMWEEEDVEADGFRYAYAHSMPLYGVTIDDEGQIAWTTTGDQTNINNELITGNLEVHKYVESNFASDLEKEFKFIVELDDDQINGTYGNIEFKNGKAEFTLKNNESVSTVEESMDIHGEEVQIGTLPANVNYKVTEVTEEGFSTVWYGNTSGTIPADDTAFVAAVNTREEGGLTVTKSVVSDASDDLNKSFDFTVQLGELNGQPLSGTFGDMTFDETGKATFSLTSGQSATATGLPEGITYTVTETADDNFDTTVEGNVEAKVVKDATPTVKFVNTKNNGPITINKQVVSPIPAENDQEFTFTIKLTDTDGTALDFTAERDGIQFINGTSQPFTVKGNDSKTINGLPVGAAYEVIEAEANSATWETVAAGGEGTITAAGATANFTNTHRPGELEVTKTVVSNTASDKTNAKQFNFKVTLSAPDGSGLGINGKFGGMEFKNDVAEFQLAHGQTIPATNLPVGVSYKVEEETQAGWVTTMTGDTGNITTSKSTATFTNNKDEGGLIVTKHVVSPFERDHTEQEFTFMVALYDENDQRITDFGGTFGSYKQTKDGKIETTPITFTDGMETFTLRDGQMWSASGLPAGVKYKVFETENPDFIQTWINQEGTIESNTVQTARVVTATNTRKPGELRITKQVISPVEAEESTEFAFKVQLKDADGKALAGTFYEEGKEAYTFDDNGEATIFVRGGETKVVSGLPVGATYTVTENDVAGFKLTGTTGTEGTITTTPAEAGFRNERELGELEVTKSVISDAAADHNNQKFHFAVRYMDSRLNGKFGDMEFKDGKAEFDLKDGEMVKATGLPAGVSYLVTESNTKGFELTGVTGDDDAIVANGTKRAAFENTRLTGRLELFKIVHSTTEADASKYFTFRVTLVDEDGINKTFPAVYTDQDGAITDTEVTFTNGVATVQLRDDEDLRIEELPMAVKYKVEEVDAEDAKFTKAWTVWANKDDVDGKETLEGENIVATGLIDNGKRAQVDFHNERREGNLTVSKEVITGLPETDTNSTFDFAVILSDNTINGEYGTMEFVDGVATFSLRGGDTATAKGLPIADDNGNAITYTVTEKDTEFFTTTLKVDDGEAVEANETTGELVADKTINVAYTNDRQEGDLDVSKLVISDLPADSEKEFTFTVELSDPTINGRYGGDTEAPVATEENPNPADDYMTFENGVATFTLKDQQTKSAIGLPAGVNYTVTEENEPGFILNGRTDYDGVITTKPSRAVFTNARITGNLTVEKHVESILDSDMEAEYLFQVVLDEDSISGTYGDMEFIEGASKEFKLKNGETATATGLPIGTRYTVYELVDSKVFEPVWGGVVTGTEITDTLDEGDNIASVTNTRKTGYLHIRKVVDSTLASDEGKEYTFTVKLSDESINGQFGAMYFTNGEATVKVKAGDENVQSNAGITALDLPYGIDYTITEVLEDGEDALYTTEMRVDDGEWSTTGTITGTIGSEEHVDVWAKNTRNTGELKVLKELVSDRSGDENQQFTFHVKLSDATITDGLYGDDEETGMTFANGEATITLKGGEFRVAKGLPAGITYTITEDSSDGFTLKGVTVDGAEVEEGADITGVISTTPSLVEFTNNRNTGGFNVQKVVESAATEDATKNFHFVVTLSDTGITTPEDQATKYGEMVFTEGKAEFDLKANESKLAANLPVGIDYVIDETFQGDDGELYTVTFEGRTSEGKIADETTPIVVKNTRKAGFLHIRKVVDSKLASDQAKEFTFEVKLSDTGITGQFGAMYFTNGVATVKVKAGGDDVESNAGITALNLPYGIGYTVTEVLEDSEKGDYNTEMRIGNGEWSETGTVTGTIGDKEHIDVWAKNVRKVADLTISKRLFGAAEGDETEFFFSIELDDKSINGTFGDLTFKDGRAVVVDDEGNVEDDIIAIPNGGSVTATGLPVNVTYTVSEEFANGYKLVGVTRDDQDVTDVYLKHNQLSGTLTEPGVTVAFDNGADGSLRIVKHFPEGYMLTDEELNGISFTVFAPDGSILATDKEGNSIGKNPRTLAEFPERDAEGNHVLTINNLEPGVYRVVETP